MAVTAPMGKMDEMVQMELMEKTASMVLMAETD